MEHRAQTYIGAVQLLAIIGGSLFLRAAVKGVDDMIIPDEYYDPLKFLRPASHFGWILLGIPIAWMVLTIRGERSDLWWATKPLTIASGIVLLLAITAFFGWAGVKAYKIVFGTL
ncbi:hypothetical protein [Haloferula sp.]|uniref:hypothetical protein n=1 Tax=Haloferula sp. TaxID=2497595 RepID=UPI0032A13A50